jgi:hypothetical protein
MNASERAFEHVELGRPEVCSPQRPPVRGGRKTDILDAIRAACEVLATEHVRRARFHRSYQPAQGIDRLRAG